MTSCTFCQIVTGDARAWRVHEDDHCVAFLDIHPATRGHTLVVPRQHAEDLLTISADDAGAVARTVHFVSRRLRDRLGFDGLNIIQANGAAAWQTVFHYHVHLVPRYEGDDLVMPWRPGGPPRMDLDSLHEHIGGGA
jgi:histidine triad (HIT) family protein